LKFQHTLADALLFKGLAAAVIRVSTLFESKRIDILDGARFRSDFTFRHEEYRLLFPRLASMAQGLSR
jgi:hypothetical protein